MKRSQQEIFNILIEEFNNRNPKELNTYDEILLRRFDKSSKTINRYFKEFQAKYQSIVEVEGKRCKTYKLITPMDLISESMEHFDEIGFVFQMIQEGSPEVFKELEQYTKKDKDIYQFQTTPFEDVSDIEANQNFQRLKRNIEAREYTKIKFHYDDVIYDNLKCLKLIFMDNNWYIAYVNNTDHLKFGRISFIQRVDYGSNNGHFQPSSVVKHKSFLLDEVQNSMTLYGVPKKEAVLKALPPIAKYFKSNMKKFLASQKWLEELDDGSILISLSYTQELELLPLVQKWLPHLLIMQPNELKEAFKVKLQHSIEMYN
jgi:hypothetical protein